MKHAINRFSGLVLLAALLVGAPLLSAKDRDNDNHKICRDRDGDRDDRGCAAVPVPDSHGGPLLVLTAGILGAALLVQRRRKIAS
jgi:MYXO-CTERM domain-containing protein